MPIGGPMYEVPPDECPSGHPWPDTEPGTEPAVRIGHRPCHCPTASRGHRTYHCETPGCPTPWVLRPPCSREQQQTIWVRPDRQT